MGVAQTDPKGRLPPAFKLTHQPACRDLIRARWQPAPPAQPYRETAGGTLPGSPETHLRGRLSSPDFGDGSSVSCQISSNPSFMQDRVLVRTRLPVAYGPLLTPDYRLNGPHAFSTALRVCPLPEHHGRRGGCRVLLRRVWGCSAPAAQHARWACDAL